MTEDTAIAPLIPPVGEYDPWMKVRTFDTTTYGDGYTEKDFGKALGDTNIYQRGDYAYVEEVDAALTLTRQQHAEQIAEKDRSLAHAHDLIAEAHAAGFTRAKEQAGEENARLNTLRCEAESSEAALRAELYDERVEHEATKFRLIAAEQSHTAAGNRVIELVAKLATARQEIETLKQEQSKPLSARWQELFWALPPGELRHKLRTLEIDTGQTLKQEQGKGRNYLQATAEERSMARGFVTLWESVGVQDAEDWLYALRNRAELLASLDDDESREAQDNTPSLGPFTTEQEKGTTTP